MESCGTAVNITPSASTASLYSTDQLLHLMGPTPADVDMKAQTADNWISEIVGQQVKSLFYYKHYLKLVSDNGLFFGPLAMAAKLQQNVFEKYVTEPIRARARDAAHSGESPDIYLAKNAAIESEYADLLQELTGFCLSDNKFDPNKIAAVVESRDDIVLLKLFANKFTLLEHGYNSLGLTRLTALKELLKCLYIVVTETDSDTPPFHDGQDTHLNLSREDMRKILENLYLEKAFNMKAYAESVIKHLGFSQYTIVKDSAIHGVTLRRYDLPKGIKPNGKIIYLASPLINRPEIYDLAADKSVIEGLLKQGFIIYLVDNGDPTDDEANLGLDFYGKTVHDKFIHIIKKAHKDYEIYAMGYCMGGTLILPYLARRAEELLAAGEAMDIRKVALMAAPFKFDDQASGHHAMRQLIRHSYDELIMIELFGEVNIPSQVIESGMHVIQPGVLYTMAKGFFTRAMFAESIRDSAPFLYWITHGTKFPSLAHRQWIQQIFMEDQIANGAFKLPSTRAELDNQPVNMNILADAGVSIFNYRGVRDPIAPIGSCIAGELWGQTDNVTTSATGLNRTIEKNVGHIFVVSKKLLGQYLDSVTEFFGDKQAD